MLSFLVSALGVETFQEPFQAVAETVKETALLRFPAT
jgi:hypothetical protein